MTSSLKWTRSICSQHRKYDVLYALERPRSYFESWYHTGKTEQFVMWQDAAWSRSSPSTSIRQTPKLASSLKNTRAFPSVSKNCSFSQEGKSSWQWRRSVLDNQRRSNVLLFSPWWILSGLIVASRKARSHASTSFIDFISFELTHVSSKEMKCSLTRCNAECIGRTYGDVRLISRFWIDAILG